MCRYPTHRFDKLLHDVPLNPLLWTRHGCQPVWSGATGGRHLVHVHGKELGACRLGKGCSRNLAVFFTTLAVIGPLGAEWC